MSDRAWVKQALHIRNVSYASPMFKWDMSDDQLIQLLNSMQDRKYPPSTPDENRAEVIKLAHLNATDDPKFTKTVVLLHGSRHLSLTVHTIRLADGAVLEEEDALQFRFDANHDLQEASYQTPYPQVVIRTQRKRPTRAHPYVRPNLAQKTSLRKPSGN